MITRWRGWASALTLIVGLGSAILVGLAMAVLPIQSSILLLCVGSLGLVLIAPWPLLFWSFMLVLGLVVGPLQYVGGFSKAFWLPYLMGVLMSARLLSDSLAGRRHPGVPGLPRDISALPTLGGGNRVPGAQGMQVAMVLAGVFATTLLVSSVAHQAGPMQVLVAGKEYLFLLSIPAVFWLGFLNTKQLSLLWPIVSLWLSIQAIAVLWQRFVVAPRRGGDAPWDAVVGLFAGKANGAGGSGTMAMVSLWAAAGVVMAWRAGLLRWPWAVLASFSALLACALAEVKVAVLLLPLLGLIAFAAPSPAETSAEAKITPRFGWRLKALSFGVTVLVSGLLLWAHQQQFTAAGSLESRSPAQYLETTLGRNLDARTWADEHGQLTRLGAIQYWWSRQSSSDIPGWLIGHGMGAVRRSALAPSEFLQGLRFDPGRSSAVILLWETGVLGLISWLLASLSFLVVGTRLLRIEQSAEEAVFLRAAVAAIAITILSLPYGADWFEAPHLAVVHLLGIGWICGAYRRRVLHRLAPSPKTVACEGSA